VHDICTGVPAAHKKHFEAAGAGHYGIFSGRRWRETVYPAVKAFIKSYQPAGAMQATPAPKAASAALAPKPVAKARRAVAKPLVAPVTKAAKTPAKATPAKAIAVTKKALAQSVRAKAVRKA